MASMQSEYCCYGKENPQEMQKMFVENQKFEISVNTYTLCKPSVNTAVDRATESYFSARQITWIVV